MGQSASKATRTAARSTTKPKRQYPTRIPPTPTPTSAAEAPRNPVPAASTSKDESIISDAKDPHFAASLRSLGVVNPASTLSHSSAYPETPVPDARQNPALLIYEARERMAAEVDAWERHGGNRSLIDVVTLRKVLALRDESGLSATEIERRLGLNAGVVGRLGAVAEATTVVVPEQGEAKFYG